MLKKVITAALGALSLVSPVVDAAEPGLYIEAQAGFLAASIKKDIKNAAQEAGIPDITGGPLVANARNTPIWLGGLSIGYQFSQTEALEAGYRGSLFKMKGPPMHYNMFFYMHEAFTATVFDLVGKKVWPVADGRGHVFIKFGAALVALQGDIEDKQGRPQVPEGKLIEGKAWGPEVSLGLSIDVTPKLVLSLSGSYIHPLSRLSYGPINPGQASYGPVKRQPGPIGFVSIGLAYHFGHRPQPHKDIAHQINNDQVLWGPP